MHLGRSVRLYMRDFAEIYLARVHSSPGIQVMLTEAVDICNISSITLEWRPE